MKHRVWRTFFRGLFLFLPLFAVFLLLARAVATLRPMLEPVLEVLPVERRIGVVLVFGLCVLLLVLIIFLFGVLANISGLSRKLETLDARLARNVPGYAILKSTLLGASGQTDATASFVPVLATFQGAARFGYEVDRLSGDRVVVFLPDVPEKQNGQAVVLPATAVEPLNIPPHKLAEILSFHGRGLEKPLEG